VKSQLQGCGSNSIPTIKVVRSRPATISLACSVLGGTPFPPQTFHTLHLMLSATADTLRSVSEPQAWRHARHKQRYQIFGHRVSMILTPWLGTPRGIGELSVYLCVQCWSSGKG
jgi:hypothetical protein